MHEHLDQQLEDQDVDTGHHDEALGGQALYSEEQHLHHEAHDHKAGIGNVKGTARAWAHDLTTGLQTEDNLHHQASAPL